MRRLMVGILALLLSCSIVVLERKIANAETLKLIAISGPPPVVLPVKVTKEFFIPEVNRRLAASGKDFNIEWTEAWSQSLAKMPEVFEAVEEGIAHLGVMLWVHEGSKLPLENVSLQVPFGTTDEMGLLRVMRNLHEKVPEMDQAFHEYNQVHLASWTTDPFQLVTDFPVERWEDVRGRKLGASGTMGLFFSNTGAAMVSSDMGAAYNSIQSGLYNGYTAPMALIFPYKMHQRAPYVTKVNFGSVSGSGLTINRDIWKKLPPHAQKIFKDVAWEAGVKVAQMSRARKTKFEAIVKNQGAIVKDFSPQERKRWAQQLPNLAQQWANRLEQRGQPGNKILKTYMNELRSLPLAGTDIVRHWDKE